MKHLKGLVDLFSTPRAFDEGVLRVAAYELKGGLEGQLVSSTVLGVTSDGQVREYPFELSLQRDGTYSLRAELKVKRWRGDETYCGGPVPACEGIRIPLKRV